MYPSPLHDTLFRLRQLVRAHTLLCIATVVTSVVATTAGFTLVGLREAVSNAGQQQLLIGSTAVQETKLALPASSARVSLQPFNSTQMVQALNDVAERTNVALNEISFTLDDGNGQPYLRYRASLAVTTKYLSMRRFIDGVHADLPDVSLDSVACAREAISTQPLKCDLVFTGFYRRSEHG